MALRDWFSRRSDGRCAAPRIQPMDVVKSPASPGMKRLIATVGGAAIGLIAVVASWEGKPTTEPHWDRLGKVWDVCYADTQIEKRTYTEAECKDILASRLADYATVVLDRNPELRGHDPQVLAASSMTYNIGGAAYRRSTVARRFSEGRWRSACDAMMMWTKAGGREIAGLRNRREAERAICLRNIPAEFDR